MSDQYSSSPTDSLRSVQVNGNPGLMGSVVGIAFLLLLIWLGYRGYEKYIADYPVIVSMAGYFVDKDNNVVTAPDAKNHTLIIKGAVHKNGQPVKSGNVRLAVSTEDGQFAQTISTSLEEDGEFWGKDSAFSSLKPDDPLEIVAQVTSSEFKESRSHEIFLNTTQPALGRTTKFLLWMLLGFFPLLLLAVFFGAFTGKKTPTKNRVAIILSYCIIGLFLAIPLLAPVLLLHAFPEARGNMVGAPVGLVVTRIGRQIPPRSTPLAVAEASPAPGAVRPAASPSAVPTPVELEDDTQWAVNIGGLSTLVSPPTPTPIPATTPTPTPGTSPNTSTAVARPAPAASPAATQTPSASPAPTTSVSPAVGTSPSPVVSPTIRPPTAATSPASAPVSPPITSPSPAVAQAAAPLRKKPDQNDHLVNVTGGLVIPLYVIILSVIGGAINMTRKVPRYQREGEFSEFANPTLSPAKIIAAAKSWYARRLARGERAKSENVPTGGATTEVEAQAPAEPNSPKPHEPAATEPATTEAEKENEEGESLSGVPDAGNVAPVAKSNANDNASASIAVSKAKMIDSYLDQLVQEQTIRSGEGQMTMATITGLVNEMRQIFDAKKADELILGCASFEDWLGGRNRLKELLGTNWRVELLNQYMYLIAAPFLAIVAYYMLDLMGLTKKPVLVLISFSVGLISERILSWLLGMASGYMRSDNGSAPPAKTT